MTKNAKLSELHITIKNGVILIVLNGFGKAYDYAEYIKRSYRNPYSALKKIESFVDENISQEDSQKIKDATEKQILDIPVIYAIIDFMKLGKSTAREDETGEYIKAYAQKCGVKGIDNTEANVRLEYLLSKRDFIFDYNYHKSRFLRMGACLEKEEIITGHEMYYAFRTGMYQRFKYFCTKKLIECKYFVKGRRKRKQEQIATIKQNEKNNTIFESAYDRESQDDAKTKRYPINQLKHSGEFVVKIDLEQNIKERKMPQTKIVHFAYVHTKENSDKIENGLSSILKYVQDNIGELKKDSKKLYRDISDGILTTSMEELLGKNGVIQNRDGVFTFTLEEFNNAISEFDIADNMTDKEKEILYYIFLQKLLIEKNKEPKELGLDER